MSLFTRLLELGDSARNADEYDRIAAPLAVFELAALAEVTST